MQSKKNFSKQKTTLQKNKNKTICKKKKPSKKLEQNILQKEVKTTYILGDDHLSVSISVLRVSLSFLCSAVLCSANFQFCLCEAQVVGQFEFLGALLSAFVNFEAEEMLQFKW